MSETSEPSLQKTADELKATRMEQTVFVATCRSLKLGLRPQSGDDLVFRNLAKLGLPYKALYEKFGWVNLSDVPCDGKLEPKVARQYALAKAPLLAEQYDRAVLLGVVVSRNGFACEERTCGADEYVWHTHPDVPGLALARMPHPSWGNPRWHDAEYAERAGQFLRGLLEQADAN